MTIANPVVPFVAGDLREMLREKAIQPRVSDLEFNAHQASLAVSLGEI